MLPRSSLWGTRIYATGQIPMALTPIFERKRSRLAEENFAEKLRYTFIARTDTITN